MVAALAEAAGVEHELVAFGPSGPRGREQIAEALAGLDVEVRTPLVPHLLRTAWSRGSRPAVERVPGSRGGRPAVDRLVGSLDVFHFSDWMYPAQQRGLRATTIHDLVPLRFPDWVEPE